MAQHYNPELELAPGGRARARARAAGTDAEGRRPGVGDKSRTSGAMLGVGEALGPERRRRSELGRAWIRRRRELRDPTAARLQRRDPVSDVRDPTAGGLGWSRDALFQARTRQSRAETEQLWRSELGCEWILGTDPAARFDRRRTGSSGGRARAAGGCSVSGTCEAEQGRGARRGGGGGSHVGKTLTLALIQRWNKNSCLFQ